MIKEGIDYKVAGYTNRWSVIDKCKGWVLLENNTYGDETCYIVTRENQKANDKKYKSKATGEIVMIPTIIGKVYETYDGIWQCLEDEGIL